MTDATNANAQRVTPTVSQTVRVGWMDWTEQFLVHETPLIKAGVNAGLNIVEGMIPGGAVIKVFVGQKIVDELVDQGLKVIEGVLHNAPTISADGSHPIASYVINMINNSAPLTFAWLEPQLDEFIKTALAKVGITI